MASTAEELSGQAERLQEAIAYFKLDTHRSEKVPKTSTNATGKTKRKTTNLQRQFQKMKYGGSATEGNGNSAIHQAEVAGIALQMSNSSGNGDDSDVEFERY
jgi:hypothetical protein